MPRCLAEQTVEQLCDQLGNSLSDKGASCHPVQQFSPAIRLAGSRGIPLRHTRGVLFNEDYSVMRAALIPHAIALEHATFVQRTNSHRFLLRDDIWNARGVRDVSEELRRVVL